MRSSEGILFRDTGENSACVTTITSTPGSGWFHRMLCEDLPVIDDNGDMNAYYLEMLVRPWYFAFIVYYPSICSTTSGLTLHFSIENANESVLRVLKGLRGASRGLIANKNYALQTWTRKLYVQKRQSLRTRTMLYLYGLALSIYKHETTKRIAQTQAFALLTPPSLP